MVNFPNAKINLGLQITGRRQDGYHDLQTIFYPVPLKDVLEIIGSKTLEFQTSGISIPFSKDSNSVLKAFELLKADYPQLSNVSIHLHKLIPSGAGLGGGSADGAFMLKMLNEKFNLGIGDAQLREYALKLGSDCPFFILNKPSFAEGRGEILSEIELDLSSYSILLINPGIHVSTADAFKAIELSPGEDLKKIIEAPIQTWKEHLKNDFEIPVFKMHPELKSIKEDLYQRGAIYASMSGSGSTMYGIFNEKQSLSPYPSNYFVKWL